MNPVLGLLTALLLAFRTLGNAPLFAADFRLGSPLSDHMVLQREKPVAIWGWGELVSSRVCSHLNPSYCFSHISRTVKRPIR